MISAITKKILLLARRYRQRTNAIGHLGKPTFISGTASFAFHKNISIGRYCRIGKNNRIDGEGGVSIGDGSIFAPNVVVLSSSHNYKQSKMLPYDNTDEKSPVNIGRGVWIGWGAIITPSVTIGDGAIVAAGSVVVKSVEKGQIVAGNPAKVVNTRPNINDIHALIANENFYLKAIFEREISRGGRIPYGDEVIK